jgi:hypothetical protein
MLRTFFPGNHNVYGICGKIWYSRVDHRCEYGTCALNAGRLLLQTHFRVRNTYCFSTAKMVTRTRLNVTFIRILFILLILHQVVDVATTGFYEDN